MISLLLALFGLGVGSFINVVVFRLPRGETLGGRSHCQACGKQLRWYHNIPLASFFYLKGRCAWCGSSISWQYPIVEATTAVLWMAGAWLMPAGDWLWLITYLSLISYLLALFVFDWRYQIIPDSLTLSGSLVLFGFNLLRGYSLASLVLGAAAAAGFFALQYYWSRGRWIGAGDIRFGLLMGAALGWPLSLMALIMAYWLGAAVAIVLLISGRAKWQSQLPLATFLAVATAVVFLWGDIIWQWYRVLLGL